MTAHRFTGGSVTDSGAASDTWVATLSSGATTSNGAFSIAQSAAGVSITANSPPLTFHGSPTYMPKVGTVGVSILMTFRLDALPNPGNYSLLWAFSDVLGTTGAALFIDSDANFYVTFESSQNGAGAYTYPGFNGV